MRNVGFSKADTAVVDADEISNDIVAISQRSTPRSSIPTSTSPPHQARLQGPASRPRISPTTDDDNGLLLLPLNTPDVVVLRLGSYRCSSVVEDAPVSPPAVSSDGYDPPQRESIESKTTKKRKRDRFAVLPPANPEIGVERPDAIHAHWHITLPPHSKEHAQRERAHPDESARRVQIWRVHVFVDMLLIHRPSF